MVVGVVVGVVVTLPLCELWLAFSRQRLLTREIGPRVAKSSGVKEWLHAPPPGRVLHQHVVAELAEQMGLFFCTGYVGSTEVVLHEKTLDGVDRTFHG